MTEVERWVQALVELGIEGIEEFKEEIGAIIVLGNNGFNEIYCSVELLTPTMMFYADFKEQRYAVFNRNVAASIFQNKGLIEKVEIEKLPEENCRVVVIHTK